MKIISKLFFNLSFLAFIVLGLIITSYVFGWTSPSNIPPGGLVYTPINVSSSNQAKQGYLAIGTSTTPSYALDIYGVIRIGQFSSAPSGTIGCLYYDTTSNKFKGYTNSGWTEIGGTDLWTASGTNIYYNTGNIGIGTSTPGAKLDIYSSVIPWNALGICKNGICCPIWKDCDGDGKTYGNGDCDESCATCYVGSTSTTSFPDNKDQDCDGIVDEEVPTCTPSWGSPSVWGYDATSCQWVSGGTYRYKLGSSCDQAPVDTTHCVVSGANCTDWSGGWSCLSCTNYTTGTVTTASYSCPSCGSNTCCIFGSGPWSKSSSISCNSTGAQQSYTCMPMTGCTKTVYYQ